MVPPDRELAVIERFIATFSDRAFEELFREMYPRVFRYFRSRSRDSAVAEELTQNVFIAVYRSARQMRESDRFRAWLFQIARNEWLQYERYRHAASRSARIESIEDHQDIPQSGEAATARLEFEQLLGGLEEEDRELLRLRFIDGFTFEEISELLGTPSGTLKWRAAQAREQIAMSLGTGKCVK